MAKADPIEDTTSALLRTLLLCDLVDSTGLVERLGDRAAAELIRKHDRLARTIADRHGGREIDKTDGFLMMFERPIQAVAFALDYQRGLKQLNAAEGTTLSARVGIHVGDVVVWDNSSADVAKGAKPTEVEGLVKPITSRLMNLALPNQILLSNIAYVLAHRAQGELGVALEKVRWRTHGRYRFRGIPDPVPVFEVGEDGLAPLKAPPWSSKAHREVPFWRRPATMVIEALVVLALLAIPLLMFMRPEPAIAFANRDWVVVGSLNNLTGETVFDEALESALRIGLEQSRYVNVLPDLKVRDTVKRMERDPDATRVDRAVGSEVAIRDGAKALILPTVAEVGGRVRITAEVIDPHTQTTVYSESADGTGAESVLGSLDTINSRLRERLGEALATVSSDSLPLEKVATRNLDALRAFSLAVRADVLGDDAQTIALLESAIRLDPGFARARLTLTGTLFNMDRRDDARAQLSEALALTDRLSTRERMIAEAWQANLESPRAALVKWNVLAGLYPDFFMAQGTYGFYAWQFANDYTTAIGATQRSAATQNPHRALSLYLLGTLKTGIGEYEQAERHFADADALGIRYENQYYASLFAARRDFVRMHEVIAAGRRGPAAAGHGSLTIARIAFAIDQAHWADARTRIDGARPAEGVALDDAIESIALAIEALPVAAGGRVPAIDRYLAERVEEVFDPARADATERDGRILFNAWLAARQGAPVIARRTMAQASAATRSGDYPVLARTLAVVEAQLALADGKPAAAITQLQPLLDGTEPFIAHLVLMDAHAATGNSAAARKEARWLSSQRGRAYTEIGAGPVWVPYNVAQTTLALLADAGFSASVGDHEGARTALAAFTTAWPDPAALPPLRERVGVLEAAVRAARAPAGSGT